MSGRFAILALLLLCSTGCARNNDGTWKAPFVYRIDVQQGNMVDQEMINKLRPGMDKKQVKYIMGTPLIIDPFHNNRWDYIYSFEPGDGEREQRRITLYFNGEHLARIDGDIKVTETPISTEEIHQDRTVAVPLEDDKPGFFKRMFSGKKETGEEDGGAPAETEETAAIDETATAAESEETTVTDEAAASMETAPDTTGTTLETVDDSTPQEDSSSGAGAAVTSTAATTGEKSTAGDPQEKNLLRRFWDRMTKSELDPDKEVETEQDIRDKEILEDAGGEL